MTNKTWAKILAALCSATLIGGFVSGWLIRCEFSPCGGDVRWDEPTEPTRHDKPPTVTYEYCYLSPLVIDMVKVGTSYDITCSDNCKSTKRRLSLPAPEYKREHIIIPEIISFFGYDKTNKSFDASVGASLSYYHMFSRMFGFGGGASYLHHLTRDQDDLGVRVGVVIKI